MAKMYREFKRVGMTPRTAREIVKWLSDRTLERHAECTEPTTCVHAETGTLAVARLIESGIHIGARRAHLDIPDEPTVVRGLVLRLEQFAERAKHSGKAFVRVAAVARRWANRSPLERLAEAGLELD